MQRIRDRFKLQAHLNPESTCLTAIHYCFLSICACVCICMWMFIYAHYSLLCFKKWENRSHSSYEAQPEAELGLTLFLTQWLPFWVLVAATLTNRHCINTSFQLALTIGAKENTGHWNLKIICKIYFMQCPVLKYPARTV